MDLKEVITKICFYAQEHSRDKEAWGLRGTNDMKYMMGHVSYVVACFLAQNTKKGECGVEWEVVVDELAGKVKTKKQWDSIASNLIKSLGGPK